MVDVVCLLVCGLRFCLICLVLRCFVFGVVGEAYLLLCVLMCFCWVGCVVGVVYYWLPCCCLFRFVSLFGGCYSCLAVDCWFVCGVLIVLSS